VCCSRTCKTPPWMPGTQELSARVEAYFMGTCAISSYSSERVVSKFSYSLPSFKDLPAATTAKSHVHCFIQVPVARVHVCECVFVRNIWTAAVAAASKQKRINVYAEIGQCASLIYSDAEIGRALILLNNSDAGLCKCGHVQWATFKRALLLTSCSNRRTNVSAKSI